MRRLTRRLRNSSRQRSGRSMSPPRKRENETETAVIRLNQASLLSELEVNEDDVLARALASHDHDLNKRSSEAPAVIISSNMSDRKITPTKPSHPAPSSASLLSSSSSRDAWHSRSAARSTANHVLNSVGSGEGTCTDVEMFPGHDYGDVNHHSSEGEQGRRLSGSIGLGSSSTSTNTNRVRSSNGEDSDSDGSQQEQLSQHVVGQHYYHENHVRHAKRTSGSNNSSSNTSGVNKNDRIHHEEEEQEDSASSRWRDREISDIPLAADSYWPSRDYETDHATTEKPPSRGWSPAFVDFVNREHKIIYFNVGGTKFATSRDTIANDEFCMLNVMLKHESSMTSSRDASGAIFIDRDPTYFSYVLNYLRNGIVDLPPEKHKLNALLREAEFYQINGLYSAVQKHRRRRARVTREGLLTMINTRGSSELMLPNTDFSGEDLSHLSLTKGMFMNCDLCEADMRYSDFERTRFSGALFRGANLSNASFTEAKLDGADLSGANLQKTQLYKCDLKNANLRGCDLMRANLQQANLQGVSLQGANLQGVILHGANLRNFDLEGANLQGANLEGANLQGAILHKANLKGANLWEANLENADLHQANLRDANLHRANMRGVVGEYLK
jgi:uncharacterized protein YjbI with pentapeptide repeats